MSKTSQLVQLIAACEESRLRLELGIAQNLQGDDLALLVAARVAALEALAEFRRLVPTSDSAFVPAHDKHVKPNRRTKKDDAA